MRWSPIGVRTRLLGVIVIAVSIALAIAVVAFYLLLGQQLSASATALARAQAEAELSTVRVSDGKLLAPEEPDAGTIQGQVWVFEGKRVLEAPRVTVEVDRAARALTVGPQRTLDLREKARLYAIPIIEKGVRYGTVVAVVSLDPYEETARAALIGSIILAVALLAIVALLARWMLGRTLRPVAEMTENAVAWSEHDLEQRFAVGEPYDELTRLGAALDTLLERIAASLRHEQRFTAELSHELRTPLARAKGEAEITLRRPRDLDEYVQALRAIDRNLDLMTETVETLLAAARHELGTVETAVDLRVVITDAVEAIRAQYPSRDVHLDTGAEPISIAAEAVLLASMTRPLLDNACRYARTAVRVSVRSSDSSAWIDVIDDGPGVLPDEVERIFEPGTRGSAGAASDRGAGLGLALASRLAQNVGGRITVSPASSGGIFHLRLPRA